MSQNCAGEVLIWYLEIESWLKAEGRAGELSRPRTCLQFTAPKAGSVSWSRWPLHLLELCHALAPARACCELWPALKGRGENRGHCTSCLHALGLV